LDAFLDARRALAEVGLEPGEELRRVQAAILRHDPGLRPAGEVTAVCPFKGLAAFEADDARFFYGRERLIGAMVARLAEGRLLAVVGPSGCGKSSVVRAGLLPALAGGAVPGSEAWPQVVMRPGERPLAELAALPARGAVAVAVDQFEEIFTACQDDAARRAFVDAIVALAEDRHRRALVVVAIRADFYGRCALYPGLARLVAGNQVLVGPPEPDELRRAIEGPAGRAGLEVQPQLTETLVHELEDAPGALPLLSTALLELWRRLRAGGRRARRCRADGRERLREPVRARASDRAASAAATG
jgi:hypothetical protein